MAAKLSNNKKQEVEVQREPPQIDGGKLTHSNFSATSSRGAANQVSSFSTLPRPLAG